MTPLIFTFLGFVLAMLAGFVVLVLSGGFDDPEEDTEDEWDEDIEEGPNQ